MQRFPPTSACDCHVHVIGPKDRFPLAHERTYTPMDATTPELQAMLARLGLDRVVLVQPSIYGADNACMLDAMAAVGVAARGVAVVADDAAGSTLDDLHRRGVRGLRVNTVSVVGKMSVDAIRERMTATAALCARNGWHLQTFLPPRSLAALEGTLLGLPVPVVIDHFGHIGPGQDDAAETDSLVRLLETGRVWVKLSAAYRIADDPADPAVAGLARRLATVNPERVVWGSDWPHTAPHGHENANDDAEVPYRDLDPRDLLNLVPEWLPDDRLQRLLLVDNPAKLYNFG